MRERNLWAGSMLLSSSLAHPVPPEPTWIDAGVDLRTLTGMACAAAMVLLVVLL